MKGSMFVALSLLMAVGAAMAGPTSDFNNRVREATARFAHELADSIAAAGGVAPPDTTPPTPTPVPQPQPQPGQLVGGEACSGFWAGWRADDADKFLTGSGYGTMKNNVNAAIKMDLGEKGRVEFDAWHQSDGCGGGQHLFYICSQTRQAIGPYDPAFPSLDGQLRMDFSVRTGKLYGVVHYDSDPDRNEQTYSDFALGYWDFPAYLAWRHVKLEWNQTPTMTTITLNGVAKSFATPRGANLIGNVLVVGNVDRNTTDSRCSSCGHNPCGYLGEARFRNFTWSR